MKPYIKLNKKYRDLFFSSITLEDKLLKILEDTIDFYSKDTKKRCIFGKIKRCLYSGKTINKNTPGCAIGRLLTPKSRESLDTLGFMTFKDIRYWIKVSNPSLINGENEFFFKNYQFFQELQNLHDGEEYWNKNGLTKFGQKKVEYIKTIIDNYYV